MLSLWKHKISFGAQSRKGSSLSWAGEGARPLRAEMICGDPEDDAGVRRN